MEPLHTNTRISKILAFDQNEMGQDLYLSLFTCASSGYSTDASST
jgi:hypothetical protein